MLKQESNIADLIEKNSKKFKLNIPDYLQRGFEICNQYAVGFIIYFFIFMMVTSIIGRVQYFGDIINRIAITPLLMVGAFMVAHDISKKQTYDFDHFWGGFRHLSPLLMMSIIQGCIFLLFLSPIFLSGDIFQYLDWFEEWKKYPLEMNSFPGYQPWYALLFIPILYLSISWMYAPFFIVFSNLKAWEALETSRILVAQQWGQFAVFYFLVQIISLSGILFFGIGILYSLPIGACILYASFEGILNAYYKDESDEVDLMEHLKDAFR